MKSTDTVSLMGVVAAMVTALVCLILPKICQIFVIQEGHVGLLYHKGKFVEVLQPGRHVCWGRNYSVREQDVRKTFLLVAGQEVLTADSIGLKLSVLVNYQVVDAVKAAHETQNWYNDLYNAAQIALRAVVGGVAVEALLNQRLEIGTQLLARVQPEATKVGINVLAVEVKDVMFPAELKRAYAMNLPTSVVITGIDSMQLLDQAVEAARTFKPMTEEQVAALLARTSEAAASGEYERFKTSTQFDGTSQNPQWLG